MFITVSVIFLQFSWRHMFVVITVKCANIFQGNFSIMEGGYFLPWKSLAVWSSLIWQLRFDIKCPPDVYQIYCNNHILMPSKHGEDLIKLKFIPYFSLVEKKVWWLIKYSSINVIQLIFLVFTVIVLNVVQMPCHWHPAVACGLLIQTQSGNTWAALCVWVTTTSASSTASKASCTNFWLSR